MLYQPIEDLAGSVHAALLRDLPPIVVREKDWDAWKKVSPGEQKERNRRIKAGDQSAFPMINRKKRPLMRDVEVQMFVQTWPTTSLGFPHSKPTVAESPAYTVVVSHDGAYVVYFRARFAYAVMEKHAGAVRRDAGWASFKADIAAKKLVGCALAEERYKAIRFRNDAAEEHEG